MINENNKTIKITLSKKQVAWLEQTANKLKISKSKLIRWSISNNVISYLQARHPTEEELKELIRIAHIEWLNDWNED